MPDHSPERFDRADRLLQRLRAERTEASADLTARLMAAEQRHWDGRAATITATVRRRWLAAAAALLLLPLSWWALPDGATVPVASSEDAVLLRLDDLAPAYVGQALVDAQLQRLARAVAATLPQRLADADTTVEDIAAVARALASSGLAGNGAAFGPDLRLASAWLQQQLPGLHDGTLATVLASLSTVAAETGDSFEAVRTHGRRLVEESLGALRRGSAEGLLSPRTTLAELADCGRLLALAPAFGIDLGAAGQLRQRLARELDRRGGAAPGPEVLAAQLYGFADLVDRDAFERTLRAWRPLTITARELAIMQHVAASIEPRMRGWTRFRLDLRQLATCALPVSTATRTDLLLCLASSSFGERNRRFSQAVAFAQRQ